MEIDITLADQLNFFSLPYLRALRCGYERILGFEKRGDRALFPAYPPFGITSSSDLRLVFPDADWTPRALQVLEETATACELVDAQNTELPAPLRGMSFSLTPFDHQYESLTRAFLYPRTALLLDCGLGKTKVTIDLMRACKRIGENVRAIVLAPSAGIVINWGNELKKHGPELVYRTTSTDKGNLLAKKRRAELYEEIAADEEIDVLITSYGCLVNDAVAIKKAFQHTVLVCDESHYLQTPTSKRTKAVKTFSHCTRRLLLSGTAAQGSPEHLYGQLDVLAPFLVGNLWSFKQRFLIITDGAMCNECKHRFEEPPESGHCWCGSKSLKKVPIVHGFRNLHILNGIVGRVALRKSAEECLDLPPLRTIDIPYQLPQAASKNYNSLVKNTAAELRDAKQVASPAAAQKILRLLQILAGFVRADEDEKGEYTLVDAEPKMQVLKDLLDAILATADSKIIIWGHFIASLDIIETLLNKMEIKYVRIDGSVKNRELLRTTFEEDPDCKVYLGQIQTGIGVDLVAANYVIYADLPYFSWAHYEQSLKRAHRIGQKRSVTVYRLFVPHSVHEYVLQVLSTKDKVVKSLVNRNLCALCSNTAECLRHDVRPFDTDCTLANSRVAKMKSHLATI